MAGKVSNVRLISPVSRLKTKAQVSIDGAMLRDCLPYQRTIAMKRWTVVPQVEYQQCEPAQVLCKHIRTTAVVDEATGRTSFQLLPKEQFVLQVIVEADDRECKLRIVENSGRVRFIWQHADRMTPLAAHSKWRRSENRNYLPVGFCSLRRLPGPQIEFERQSEFVAYLVPILGSEFVAQVMELFRWRRPLCGSRSERAQCAIQGS
jgi:hypothetical protein